MSQRSVNLPCGPALHDFLLRTDRGVYESGQTMRLTADGGGHQPVFVDILKGDQTLLSETIEMTEGRGTFAFDLPPDLFGTVRLCAYRLDTNGVMLSKTRVVYIRPAGQLKIASKLDQKEYRPGRRAHLDLTLTDTDGKPCPGAISLAGVDEAVFSVLSQRPGSEETFYTVERQLLQPVYSLYPWSPQRKARDGGRLEQALFAATVRSEVKNSASGCAHSNRGELAWQGCGDRARASHRPRTDETVVVGAGVADGRAWIYRAVVLPAADDGHHSSLRRPSHGSAGFLYPGRQRTDSTASVVFPLLKWPGAEQTAPCKAGQAPNRPSGDG